MIVEKEKVPIETMAILCYPFSLRPRMARKLEDSIIDKLVERRNLLIISSFSFPVLST